MPGSMNTPAQHAPTDDEDNSNSNVQVVASSRGNLPPSRMRKLKRSACLVCFVCPTRANMPILLDLPQRRLMLRLISPPSLMTLQWQLRTVARLLT